jgi:hypothetical protein
MQPALLQAVVVVGAQTARGAGCGVERYHSLLASQTLTGLLASPCPHPVLLSVQLVSGGSLGRKRKPSAQEAAAAAPASDGDDDDDDWGDARPLKSCEFQLDSCCCLSSPNLSLREREHMLGSQ